MDTIRKVANLPPKFRPFHGLRHHFAVTLANSGQFLPESMTAAGNAAAKILAGL